MRRFSGIIPLHRRAHKKRAWLIHHAPYREKSKHETSWFLLLQAYIRQIRLEQIIPTARRTSPTGNMQPSSYLIRCISFSHNACHQNTSSFFFIFSLIWHSRPKQCADYKTENLCFRLLQYTGKYLWMQGKFLQTSKSQIYCIPCKSRIAVCKKYLC